MKNIPTPYHHGDLRNAIVTLATKTVEKNGADALSLRACAREIGVDVAAVYRHFKSKNTMLVEITRIAFTKLAEEMEACEQSVSPPDPEKALLAIAVAYVKFAKAHPHLFDMMFSISAKNCAEDVAGKSPTGRSPWEILEQSWKNIIDANGKSIADDNNTTLMLWGIVHGLANLINQGRGPQDALAISLYIEEACRAMITGRLAALPS